MRCFPNHAVAARNSDRRFRITGAGLLAYEDGIVILTLIGLAGHKTPTDLSGVLDAATELLASTDQCKRCAQPNLSARCPRSTAPPVCRAVTTSSAASRRDSSSSPTPSAVSTVWGQGMTSAALQAVALHECLSDVDDGDFSWRYFSAAAKKLAPIWWTNRFIDFAVMPADDWCSKPNNYSTGARTRCRRPQQPTSWSPKHSF
jgi:hypothetical protein